MIRAFSASHECGCRLAAAGIPLDYMNSLPRDVGVLRKRLYIGQVGGYVESRVIDLGDCGVRYVIAVRLRSNHPGGIIISKWSIATPWSHLIDWNYDPRDIVPARDRPTYEGLFDSKLSAVLNEQRRLSRGRTVDGLLCGSAFFQLIPKSIPGGTTVYANLSLTDNTGQVFARDMKMIVDRTPAPRLEYEQRKGRLLDKPDFAAHDSISVQGKQKRGRAAPRRRSIRVRRRVRSKGTS